MAFAKDRDLLALEPGLLREAAWSGQRVVSTSDAAVSGTSLVSASADFESGQIEAGHVALVEEVPLEVTARLSATQLAVSLLRPAAAGAAIPPTAASGARLAVYTFGPQIEQIHRPLMRSVGIDPDGPDEATPGVGDVVNAAAVARVEALGALHLVYSASAAMAGETSRLWAKAQMYRERFGRGRAGLRVDVDLDGDGAADASRSPSAAQLVRS